MYVFYVFVCLFISYNYLRSFNRLLKWTKWVFVRIEYNYIWVNVRTRRVILIPLPNKLKHEKEKEKGNERGEHRHTEWVRWTHCKRWSMSLNAGVLYMKLVILHWKLFIVQCSRYNLHLLTFIFSHSLTHSLYLSLSFCRSNLAPSRSNEKGE